jgi:hypothetical protein
VLSVLYDQMKAAADSGDRKTALARSAQIIQIAPGFRDVKAKQAEYLDEVYALAMRSIEQSDWRSATALLTLLTQSDPNYKDAQTKLAQAQVERRKPLPGAYRIGDEFGDGDWKADVRGITVESDGRITVFVDWTNGAQDARPPRCSADRPGLPPPALVFDDRTTWFPLDAQCLATAGDSVEPGGSFAESATFPAISDGTKPFRIDWYGLVTTGPITLVS